MLMNTHHSELLKDCQPNTLLSLQADWYGKNLVCNREKYCRKTFSKSYQSFAWFFFWKWIAFACSIFQRHWLDKSGTNGDRVLPAASGGSSGMLSIGKSHLGRGYKQIRIILFKHSFVCRLCS